MRIGHLTLATWRLTEMLVSERGPYGLLIILRGQFRTLTPVVLDANGAREFVMGVDDASDRHWLDTDPGLRRELGLALHCPYCLSPWIAGILLLADAHPVGRRFVDLLAVAGAVAALLEVEGALLVHAGVPDDDGSDLGDAEIPDWTDHGESTDPDLASP
jgi:hypothetical protein